VPSIVFLVAVFAVVVLLGTVPVLVRKKLADRRAAAVGRRQFDAAAARQRQKLDR
jgi:hypothetical protein